MSDDKRGLSLRRKKTSARPKISAPQQLQRAPASNDSRWNNALTPSTSQNSISAPSERPSLAAITGDKTSDLVKRRYSTRFTGPGDFGGAGQTNVPAVPSLPSQYARAPVSGDGRSPIRDDRDRPRDGKLKIDVRALNDANLQPERYIQSLLAEASADDIRAFQIELQNVRAHASADLQHNVYQNRTQFIKIAKEADKLKTEMRTLRTLMGELTGALGHATSAGGSDTINSASTLAERKRANRSSVANLEAMWSTHLQVLWKRVEGSQKYLPAMPGRHIILESQKWVELNAATWKPRRRVALVLLNDHLLVASEKKRTAQEAQTIPKKDGTYNAASQTTFVAERCWPLSDVTLADLASSTTPRSSVAPGRSGARENEFIKNAINIRAASESFTYATSDAVDKASFLVAFRKAQEDLRKRAAAEHGERERAMDELALLTGRDPRSVKRAAAAAAEKEESDFRAGLGRSNSLVIDVEGRQQSIRNVEAQIDALDIDIALQRFEDAVNRVEKLRTLGRGIKGNLTAQEIILSKVNERATKLATSIARQLVQTSAGARQTKDNVSFLLRLGFEDMARNRYLDARTESLRLRQRQLPFTGPLPPYLQALSFVTFNHMSHTFRTFSASFPPASGSAVVKWGREKMDDFCSMVGRQVEGVPDRTPMQMECQQAVLNEMHVLSEVGVDFGSLLLQSLRWDGQSARSSPTKTVNPGLGISS